MSPNSKYQTIKASPPTGNLNHLSSEEAKSKIYQLKKIWTYLKVHGIIRQFLHQPTIPLGATKEIRFLLMLNKVISILLKLQNFPILAKGLEHR
jgi:hypothetical protein